MLYKYAKWDKYTQENLRNSQLRFNTPEQFNDPFDSYPRFSMDNGEREKWFDLSSITAEHRVVMDQMSDDELNDLARIRDRHPLDNSKHGITCFTKKNDNILMWSHYADSHRGICMGFDWGENDTVVAFLDGKRNRGNFSFLEKGGCFPISYCTADHRPVFSFCDSSHFGETMENKFDMWSYEEEFRFRVVSARQGVLPTQLYNKPRLLKEIIICANMPLQHFVQCCHLLEELPNRNEIKIFVAMLSNHAYKLEIRQLSYQECKILLDNYEGVSKTQKLLSYKTMCEFTDGKKYRRGKKRKKEVHRWWKSALKDIPLYILMMNHRLWLNSNMTAILNAGGTAFFPLTTALPLSIFMDYMRDRMEYLYLMKQKHS